MNDGQRPERRKSPRLAKSLPLKISADNFDIVTETKNLSSFGAYCQVNKFIEPLTKLKIILLLPFQKKDKIVSKKISCEGVVVRSEAIPLKDGHYNIAIYFSDIQKKEISKITGYINSLLNKKSSFSKSASI